MTTGLDAIRHKRSMKDFPKLKLEDDEYVELAISRSKLCLILVWGAEVVTAVILAVILMLIMGSGGGDEALGLNISTRSFLCGIVSFVYLVLFATGVVGTIISNRNKMFVTNKRVIQIVCSSLFSQSTNVIDLSQIEDASFKQNGAFEFLFRLGTIRLATVGDETTYTFKYVSTPTDELETISHLVNKAHGNSEKK